MEYQENLNHGEECCICEEIKTRQMPLALLYKYSIPNRICCENETFVVFPTVSPLTSGHVLVFPKEHMTSLSCLSLTSTERLLNTIEKTFRYIEGNYGSPFLFEHGIGNGRGEGCGINHAHLHILPLSEKLRKKVQLQVMKDFGENSQGRLYDILILPHAKESSYLLFGSDLNKIHISFKESVPSQYMRKLITLEKGKNEWDWQTLSGYAEFRATYMSLQNDWQ